MHSMYTLFIALANNVDNISVRIAYSIRGLKISAMKNLWISVITFFISGCAAYSGTMAAKIFNPRLTPIISMVLLVGIGLWIILEPYLKKEPVYELEMNSFEMNSMKAIPAFAASSAFSHSGKVIAVSNEITYREATYLGITLSINNIGGGLSAGMIGLNSFFVGFFSALVSFIALWLGNYITELFNKWDLGKKANIISGLVLILIGLKQVLF